MTDAERLATIRRAVQGILAEPKDFPVRMDEMTPNEGTIADIVCELGGTLKFILGMTDPEPPVSLAPGGEPANWLILSIKYSHGSDHLVWFKPSAAGYTTDLERAGRFTRADARQRTCGDEKINVPVPVERAYAMVVRPAFVESGEANVKKLTEVQS